MVSRWFLAEFGELSPLAASPRRLRPRFPPPVPASASFRRFGGAVMGLPGRLFGRRSGGRGRRRIEPRWAGLGLSARGCVFRKDSLFSPGCSGFGNSSKSSDRPLIVHFIADIGGKNDRNFRCRRACRGSDKESGRRRKPQQKSIQVEHVRFLWIRRVWSTRLCEIVRDGTVVGRERCSVRRGLLYLSAGGASRMGAGF